MPVTPHQLRPLCTPLIVLLRAAPAQAAETPSQLAARHHCLACHAVDETRTGPSFSDVAQRYAGKAGTLAYLRERLKLGGSGAWGSTPMPPENVPPAELDRLLAWILNNPASDNPR